MTDQPAPPTPPASTGGIRDIRDPEPPVVVVGAGMAGLTCAVELDRAGRQVVVLEAGDGVGGRIRTDRHDDGFLLDRGYQVVLDAYPAIRRQIDPAELRSAPFDAGTLVWTGKRLVPLANPLVHPSNLVRDLTSTLFPAADKVRLAAFGLRARAARWESAREAAGPPEDDRSAADALWEAGFTRKFVDRFARPFWGGITLDPTLSVSAGPVKFTLKMFIAGRAVLPEQGVQALPDRLLGRLPVGTVRLGQRVERIVVEDGRATGVAVDGAVIPASAVVVATDPPAARRLTGIELIPDESASVGSTTVYLAGRRDPGLGKRITLDGTGRMTVNEVVPLSAVQPSYAPAGRHLLAVALVGEHAQNRDDEAVARQARAEAARIIGHAPEDWEILKVARVPFAQFAQPPGVYGRLPEPATPVDRLFLSGEILSDSSSNGAIIGGELAAQAVLRAIGDRR